MIKVGDRVIILPRKEEWILSPTNYVDDMTQYVGNIYKVEHIETVRYSSGLRKEMILRGVGFHWAEEWLEKVEEEVSLYD